jgi:hypothetical protein
MLMLVGMRNPLGTRNPHGYEFGQIFIPVIGMSFLAGVFFLRGYEFGHVGIMLRRRRSCRKKQFPAEVIRMR